MQRGWIVERCVWVMVLAAVPALVSADEDALTKGDFLRPPDSARPWVYWFWMDGNSSREGITADLEDMKRAGIGGALMLEVDCGIPKGPVKFMSPAWRAMFRHAATEAARLGLQLELNAGPGWTGNGGPWVRPEQSMQTLVFSETPISGPSHFDGILAQPPTKEGFYRDVAVLAFPTPADAFRNPEVRAKAMYDRNFYWAPPGAPSHIPSAGGPAAPDGALVPLDRIVDLTAKMSAAGRLSWDAPAGNWTVMRFGRTSTGAKTIPAPEAGIGLESDKLDRAALDAHFEAYLGALIADIGPLTGQTVTSLHVDSWEIGPQNWTGAFREEFRRRRGYDLLPYLPAMTGRVVGNLEISERFLWDVRQTVSELIVENNGRGLAELAHGRGMRFSLEAYDGTPCADLSFGGTADVPMCEFWTNSIASWFSCVEAASIAHTNGRPIVAAEAFTANFEERWRFHPGSIKTVGDWAFCQGVNRFAIHRYAHQPWLDRFPGMTMGPWGIHFERTQTWWDMAPAFNTYLARCQYLLQRGLPVADICYLVPEGSPSVFRPPASAVSGDPPDHLDYNFDGCAPEVVLRRMSVKDRRLVLPDGMSYAVLVLPETGTMTPELLRKIAELVRAGAVVVGAPPKRSPSLAGFPQCDEEVQRLAGEVWGEPAKTSEFHAHVYGEGVVIWNQDAERPPAPPTTAPAPPMIDANRAEVGLYADYGTIALTLRELGVYSDFRANGKLSYTHRRVGDTDVYFVANRSDQWVAADGVFRVTGKVASIWDPMSGRITPPLAYREMEDAAWIPLWLEPAGSRFVIFQPRAGGAGEFADPVAIVSRDDGRLLVPIAEDTSAEPPDLEPFTADTLLAWRAGRYELTTATGRITSLDVPALPPSMALTGPWEVRFQPQRGAPEKTALDTLADLSKHAHPGVRHFSGIATYRQEFSVAPELIADHRRLFLDLGRVEVAARVMVNGKDLGVLWKTPFRVDITAAAQAGANTLEVAVANLWCNRLIADAGQPEDQRVTWTTWNPFKPDDPLPESGLLGPVTLHTAAVVVLR